MDRELSASFKRKRKRRISMLIIVGMTFFIVAFCYMRVVMGRSVSRNELAISEATIGKIEATIAASGKVVPEHEFSITCPIRAKIEQIFYHAGEAVPAGASILKLDRATTFSSYTNLLDEQQLNFNKADQLKLALQRSLNELSTQQSVKGMQIKSLETALEHERSLQSIGGSTEEKVKQAALTLNISLLEQRQLKLQVMNQEASMANELKSLNLQMNIHRKHIAEIEKKLKEAELRSPAHTVVNWVNEKTGAEIAEGTELVRLADLSSYKIAGKIADSYAGSLKMGGEVLIRTGGVELRGFIVNIEPEVKEGMIQFTVNPVIKNHQALRASLHVDLFIITAVKKKVLRLKNGTAFTGMDSQRIFVLKGAEAVQRTVKVGLSNFEFVEILSGLRSGEQVIVSDMRRFGNIEEIKIND